jgi:Ca-activated chloride channel family protein
MNLLAELHQLHLLRPWWLLAALPAIFLTLALWRTHTSGGSWQRAIAPELLQPLLEPGAAPARRRWLPLLLLAWLLATVALSGPAWQRLPQPVVQRSDALVIALDLSLSMLTQDVTPSRLQRARYKILDVLTQRREGTTALVAYAGSAHVVAPLTDDTATLANLLPALSPQMMPQRGSDPAAAIDLAIELLQGAGAQRGRILLVSDGIRARDVDAIAARLDDRWQLSILGVGTLQGAPLPLEGGFARAADGSIAVPKLSRAEFEALAHRTGGRYRELSADASDIEALLAMTPFELDTSVQSGETRQFDQWRDCGALLTLPLLPLAALLFRRGWLLTLVIAPLLLTPATPAHADTAAPAERGRLETLWRNLWLRPDQQASAALEAGDAQRAAEQFEDPAWRGAAHYRAGDFAAAAQAFSAAPAANGESDYNRGNALARAGQLQQALEAYDRALQLNPGLDDARFNRELVERLLKQQQTSQEGNPSQDGSQPEQNRQTSDAQSDGESQQGNDQRSSSASSTDPRSEHNEDHSAAPSDDDDSAGDNESNTGSASAADDEPDQPSTDEDDSAQPNAAATPGKAQTENGGERTDGADADELQQQREQARTEQWLRQIPDDPGGLLQRKFLYEQRLRERDGKTRAPDQPAW